MQLCIVLVVVHCCIYNNASKYSKQIDDAPSAIYIMCMSPSLLGNCTFWRIINMSCDPNLVSSAFIFFAALV